ncbi:tryptophan aminotransferase-related protein 4-like [Tasmannia lanceolata]|uniref:tryptophan aminotransferase-related protein 4-like n=1 Tax=Tasmannia lanceolata TaxID=3420 RepID=UPI0040645561
MASKKYSLFFSSSLLLNLLFLYLFFVRETELTWSRKASREAEVVASLPCSGHGRAFLDGLLLEGEPVCECYSCYQGSDCSEFPLDCPADADSGDPLFLEPFWMKEVESSSVMVAGWYRMSYIMGDGLRVSRELERHIRMLHEVVRNANTSGKFIVFGVGSTQLLNAVVHALSANGSSSPASVVSQVPTYPAYQFQTELFKSQCFEWKGDASQWKNATSDSSRKFIEFVTSPNNPDGRLQKAVLEGSSVRTIHDHAYYWPHFTSIPAPADEDVMLFSISKVTGHAGSRFGWAIIKDEGLYDRILRYVDLNTMGVSHDTQLRALNLVKQVLKGGGRDFFGFGYRTMKDRWERLNKSLSISKRFSVQKLTPHYCTYFREVAGPSPAYAWLKCEMEEDEDCYAVLRAAGIIGRDGNIFGVQNRYVRLSLIKSRDDFDWLLRRIDALVAEEGVQSI